MSGTVLGPGLTAQNKADTVSALMEFMALFNGIC